MDADTVLYFFTFLDFIPFISPITSAPYASIYASLANTWEAIYACTYDPNLIPDDDDDNDDHNHDRDNNNGDDNNDDNDDNDNNRINDDESGNDDRVS